ncbi:MAG: ABC transporter permease [Clostridiales bacterium]|nr:ABC transporter permease [Clostridiales bacterium]
MRFYGLLKNIGITRAQLKHIVRRQALSLCIVGIPAGLVMGYMIGRLLMPTVLKVTDMAEDFVITVNPLVFVGAAAFALLTD